MMNAIAIPSQQSFLHCHYEQAHQEEFNQQYPHDLYVTWLHFLVDLDEEGLA